jgi:FkbM family methyltransferase
MQTDAEWCSVSELPPKKRVIVNSFRMKLNLSEWIQQAMASGAYEPEQTSWFKKCLKPGDIAIDVGASFGYYTTLSSSIVGPTGLVFAFEPSPIANRTIEEAINDSGVGNVILTKSACGSKNTTLSLFLPNAGNLHSPSLLPSDSEFIPVNVPVIRLDEFGPILNKDIKLIKIDVEGYEPDVIDGMLGLMKEKRVANIICEFNSGWLIRNSTTPQQLLSKFADYSIVEKTVYKDYGTWNLQDIWFTR